MSQPLQVDLQTAYTEACIAIGESHTRERLLHRRVIMLEQQVATLEQQLAARVVDDLTATVGQ